MEGVKGRLSRWKGRDCQVEGGGGGGGADYQGGKGRNCQVEGGGECPEVPDPRSRFVAPAADFASADNLVLAGLHRVEGAGRRVERAVDGGRQKMLRLHRQSPRTHFRCHG